MSNRRLDLERDREICLRQMVSMKLVMSDKEKLKSLTVENQRLTDELEDLYQKFKIEFNK